MLLFYFLILTFAYFAITSPMPIRGMYNIANFAAMDFNSITTSNKYGVRPVISVSKNQIG